MDRPFLREDAAGVTVTTSRDLHDNDTDYLRWRQINDAITKLGGSWVKGTRYTEGHWRIPKSR